MRFFHSLAGIGASHGFVAVTALAKEGELECVGLRRVGAKPGAGEIDNWRRLVDALEHELRTPALDAPSGAGAGGARASPTWPPRSRWSWWSPPTPRCGTSCSRP